MKRIAICLILLLKIACITAQYNLVPNPSFEVFDTCPTNIGQIRHAMYWSNPLHPATPDYFNFCSTNPSCITPGNQFGYETAHSGVAYSGIITVYQSPIPIGWNYREYLQTELIDTLKQNVNYCIRFFVSPGDSMRYVCNNIGVYFSSSQTLDTCYLCNLPLTPQFENPATNNLDNRNGWTEISGSYTAMGGEKYIIIGNFHDTASTIFSYVGWGSNNYQYAYYYIDDVLITPCDSLTNLEELNIDKDFSISPNPSDYFLIKSQYYLIESIDVYDALGRLIYFNDHVNKRLASIDLLDKKKGVYFLKIKTYKNQFNYKLVKN